MSRVVQIEVAQIEVIFTRGTRRVSQCYWDGHWFVERAGARIMAEAL